MSNPPVKRNLGQVSTLLHFETVHNLRTQGKPMKQKLSGAM
jgi:hypothetical protein